MPNKHIEKLHEMLKLPKLPLKGTGEPPQLEKLQLKLGDSMHSFDTSIAHERQESRKTAGDTIVLLVGVLSGLVGGLLSYIEESRLGSLKKDVAWMALLALASVLFIRLFVYILQVREPS